MRRGLLGGKRMPSLRSQRAAAAVVSHPVAAGRVTGHRAICRVYAAAAPEGGRLQLLVHRAVVGVHQLHGSGTVPHSCPLSSASSPASGYTAPSSSSSSSLPSTARTRRATAAAGQVRDPRTPLLGRKLLELGKLHRQRVTALPGRGNRGDAAIALLAPEGVRCQKSVTDPCSA